MYMKMELMRHPPTCSLPLTRRLLTFIIRLFKPIMSWLIPGGGSHETAP